jgi:alpha-N-arabinofuranosidase
LGRPNPEWDRTVLFETVGLADMISVHNYFGRPIFRDSMSAFRVCEAMFNGLNALIDEAADTALGVHPLTHRELGSPPAVPFRPLIAFDEWNVWYRSKHDPEHDLEEYFNFGDALTVASLLHVVLRNARTVGLSNISLALNTLALMMADKRGLFKQTTWYAHKAIRDAHAAGRVVETPVAAPVFCAKHERFFCGIVNPEKARDEKLPSLLHFNDVSALDVLASIDDHRKRMTLSVIQKLEDRPLTAALTFRGVTPRTDRVMVTRLVGASVTAGNTMDQPEAVHLTTETVRLGETVTFPPASLTVFEFDL